MKKTIACLYCGCDNLVSQNIAESQEHESRGSDSGNDNCCTNCGMALPQCHPHSSENRTRVFKIAYVLIAVFCVVMVFYLPR